MANSKRAFKIALGNLVLTHPGVNASLYEELINQYVDELEELVRELEREVKILNKKLEEGAE